MRRLLTLATVLVIACGSPSGPELPEEPTGTPSLAIVSGDNQEVAVTDTLPFDAEVQVMRGGEPVGDQLVDWRVLEDNAGEPFVTTTRTDSKGFTSNRVIAGTRAHTHPDMDGAAHMEVRWVEQSTGDAIVDTTITFRVLPGEVESILVDDNGSSGACLAQGDTVSIRDHVTELRDQYQNPVPLSALDTVPASAVSWQWKERVKSSVAEGPSGSGWTAVVDTATFRQHGYVPRSFTSCTSGDEYMLGLHATVSGFDLQRLNFLLPAP